VSFADRLLVLWWIAFPPASLATFLFLRWHNRREKKLDELALLRGELTTGLSPLHSPKGSLVFALRALIATALLIVALFSIFIFWNGNETQLYFLSAQILLTLFGAATLVFPIKNPSFRSYKPKPNSWGAAVLRASFALFGLFLLVFFGAHAFGDLLLSRQIVEGRVDRAWVDWDWRHRALWRGYRVVIDGKRFDTTNEVYSHLRVGDRVRAQIGVGSQTIFRAEVIEPSIWPSVR
jgi:hypothetical protein